MRLPDYLTARDESQSAFAKRAGLPQSTVNLVCQGSGTRVETALKIIRASRDEPAPGGGTVTLEDLVPVEASEGAA
jgi:predicted transcriptional regulator